MRNLSAKYITFLDSDDFLADEAIDKLLTTAFRNNSDIVQGAWINFRNETDNTIIKPKTLSGFPWGKIFRKDIFVHFQFPEGYWFEDTPLSFFLYYAPIQGRIPKIDIIDKVVYHYRINPKGITASASKSTKSLDSYYVTELCLKEFTFFQVKYDQRAYEYFIHQCVMNYIRIWKLEKKIRTAEFVKECELKRKYFNGFHTCNDDPRFSVIEKAMDNMQFSRFAKIAIAIGL